jgi:hypothetical protein
MDDLREAGMGERKSSAEIETMLGQAPARLAICYKSALTESKLQLNATAFSDQADGEFTWVTVRTLRPMRMRVMRGEIALS